MAGPLLDDVKALLDKDFGDDRILKQILRACENNEVISNYERNYVARLAQKYLGPTPASTPIKKSLVADTIPQIQSTRQPSLQTMSQISYKPKRKKMMLGIAGLSLLIIIVAAGVLFSGDDDPTIIPPINQATVSLSIQTDSKTYSNKDFISISGVSDSGADVTIFIQNQNDELVWTETVSLKNGGKFSTIAIAGGSGWEESGTYTIIVDNGSKETSDKFSFTL